MNAWPNVVWKISQKQFQVCATLKIAYAFNNRITDPLHHVVTTKNAAQPEVHYAQLQQPVGRLEQLRVQLQVHAPAQHRVMRETNEAVAREQTVRRRPARL